MSTNAKSSSAMQAPPPWLDIVRRKAEGLREGRISIEVADRQVMEIVCEETTCLLNSASSSVSDNEADQRAATSAARP
jgi:hypothetical protein